MIESVYEATRNWCENKGLSFYHQNEVDSTNDWAKREAKPDQDLSIFLANQQTAGRGRGTNAWIQSGPNEALLLTIVFSLKAPPQPIASPCFGLALFRSARATWPSLEWSLKAPNDLNLGGKKLAGLLLETVQSGQQIQLMAGLGMNILAHPESEKSATHLNSETGLGSELTDDRWHLFLDQWLSHFSLAAQACTNKELDPNTREELVEALNRNPGRANPIIEVSEKGDLVYDDKTVSWKDL